jgi:hypothetical protein
MAVVAMLTRDQRRKIYLNGISTFHDYWFMSLYAGEPFFEDGALAYYDGRLVRLYGFPLRGEPPIEDSSLRRLVMCWASERGAEAIVYVGPRPLNLNFLGNFGFWRTVIKPRRTISAELIIDCTRDPGNAFETRSFKRSRTMVFETKIQTGGIVLAEHLQLIEKFYRSQEITPYFADVAFAIPALLRSDRVEIIEVRKDGCICGLLALHKPFKDMAVALFMAHDHQTAGISDFLFGEMIDHTRQLGVSSTNVGSSPSRGHYNFKRKWGGTPAVPPYYLVKWARGQLAESFYPTWGPRLVDL